MVTSTKPKKGEGRDVVRRRSDPQISVLLASAEVQASTIKSLTAQATGALYSPEVEARALALQGRFHLRRERALLIASLIGGGQ